MAVLVGIMLQIDEDGPLAPSSLFFFVVAGEMIIAAFLHPQEFICLPAGVVYYVTVPSMYLLLIVYSIFNLNVVSWGTRETVTKKSKMVRNIFLVWSEMKTDLRNSLHLFSIQNIVIVMSFMTGSS